VIQRVDASRGANTLMTRILGGYAELIYAEVKRRLLYVIDRAVGFPADERDTRRLERRL